MESSKGCPPSENSDESEWYVIAEGMYFAGVERPNVKASFLRGEGKGRKVVIVRIDNDDPPCIVQECVKHL